MSTAVLDAPRGAAVIAPTAHGANHFNLLRLAAAIAVLLSHGEFLYRLSMPVPFAGHSLGSLAVYCFFFISGYLVCQSWEREPDIGVFWAKRVARIFPGLVVATAFAVFVLGWAMTQLPTAQYWSDARTWVHFLNNAVGLAIMQVLPGVFESNPFARSVNGSLWTIRYELLMYLLLSMAGVAGWTRRRWVYPVAALLMAVSWQWARVAGWDAWVDAGPRWLTALFHLFHWAEVSGFGVAFLLGCTFAAYRVRSGLWLLAVAVLGGALAWFTPQAWSVQIGVWALVAAGIFWAAHVGGGRSGGWLREDLSYGVYIYAFPIQQAVTEISLRRGWSLAVCIAVSLALTLAMAAFSWFCIEKPGVRYGRRVVEHWSRRRGLRMHGTPV
ncbi:acyltransferase [Acidovorax sp. SUPP2539]|uniref:acyltransferase family protein n=1 Tax=Acidovorax sp. SUPP2539 TaxID=2920878 RepID=UPI0023DE59F6|nr:acyltransferase [Acidovorax sp. SUPP2539]GKS92148.1 acyltransferase [Acidovorax sp. SUPP2539]